jgi:5,10-methylene-tetrahydrofolate dehydrogenase/methenyl tetrahydrofolate cyclohydrolase
MTLILDAAAAAEHFKQQIRAQVARSPESLVLVGVLAADSGPSVTYARYAQKACEQVGVSFQLRRATRLDAEQVIREANADPNVHGIMVYYPVFGTQQDGYLRDTVAPSKDIEGLHSFWARCLYENRRFIDPARTHKAILPCTPLAIVKLVEAAGLFAASGRPLAGKTACVFNRSEVVGRPLACMLAHDGARVISFDIDGPLLFSPADTPEGPHRVSEIQIDRKDALVQADLVITGVPSKSFDLIGASEIRAGSVCINFSTYQNFASELQGVTGKAGTFAPRVGPMTVTMALRNLLRLHDHAVQIDVGQLLDDVRCDPN